MNKIQKTPAELDCPIVLWEQFFAIGDDTVCTTPIMADEDILEFIENSKNIVDADSDDENEMDNAAPLPMSSEMRNIMKSLLHMYEIRRRTLQETALAIQPLLQVPQEACSKFVVNTRLHPWTHK
ncbi:hypothetical protein TNCV_1672221 [Trichonephila clavipes]|nr:hypothetical protein TNCV_1672221 [Trichonephila clavipes]